MRKCYCNREAHKQSIGLAGSRSARQRLPPSGCLRCGQKKQRRPFTTEGPLWFTTSISVIHPYWYMNAHCISVPKGWKHNTSRQQGIHTHLSCSYPSEPRSRAVGLFTRFAPEGPPPPAQRRLPPTPLNCRRRPSPPPRRQTWGPQAGAAAGPRGGKTPGPSLRQQQQLWLRYAPRDQSPQCRPAHARAGGARGGRALLQPLPSA